MQMDKSNEVPEEIPLTSYFGNAINYKEIEAPKSVEPNPLYTVVKYGPTKIKFLEECSQEKKDKVLKDWDATETTEDKSFGIYDNFVFK